MFPTGSEPSVSVPWPRWSWERPRPRFEQATVEVTLGRPPRLQEVDPRVLWANRPRVARAGVDYYLNDSRYRRFGRTYADRDQVANRFPFIYRHRDGRKVILVGHHRAAAALVAGEALLAIVASSPWGDR